MKDVEELLDDGTAQQVYDELGYQIDQIDNVLESYRENKLAEIESFEKLEQRRARFSKMRGILREVADKELRHNSD